MSESNKASVPNVDAQAEFVKAFVPAPLARFVKHMDDPEGRDKFGKFVQYGARFLMYHALQSDPKSDFGIRMRGLFGLIRDARKLSRLLKTLNEYKKLIEILAAPSPAHHKALEALSRIGFGAYWFFDNVSWMSKGKVLKYNEKDASWWGGLGWFIGTLCSVLIAAVKLYEGFQKEASLTKTLESTPATDFSARQNTQTEINKVRTARFTHVLNIIKNGGDCTTASNSIDIWEKFLVGYKLNDGVIGLCGMTSAGIASWSAWQAGNAKK